MTTAPGGLCLGETPEQDIALTEDRREQVVEIMRQAACEPAHGLHPLSQLDLLCVRRSSRRAGAGACAALPPLAGSLKGRSKVWPSIEKEVFGLADARAPGAE